MKTHQTPSGKHMDTEQPTRYFLPTRSYDLVAAVNRLCIATGTTRMAMAASHADYNGHHVTVRRNDFAYGGYIPPEQRDARGWRAIFTWSGINWLARGTNFQAALDAAVREYNRGALGASVSVCDVDTDEKRAACEAAGLQPWSEAAEAAADASWRTWAHDAVSEIVRDYRDWGVDSLALARASSDLAQYRAKVDETIKARRAAR
jgi:hypothetical protein